MALNQQLSAIRELILGSHQLPLNLGERVSYLQGAFPHLALAEVEDLAKMDPERLGIYTSSIFSGEKSLLKSTFPISYKLLASVWKSIYGQPFNGFKMVHTLHQRFPWKSILSTALFKNFVDGVPVLWPEVVSEVPALPEILQFEFLTALIKRCDCPRVCELGGRAQAELRSLQVQELMTLSMSRPASTGLFQSSYDVLSLYHDYHQRDGALPDTIEKKSLWAIGGRDNDFHCRWMRVSKPEFAVLNTLNDNAGRTVEDLAEAYVASSMQQHKSPQQAISEEQLFIQFFERLINLVEIGAIIIK